MHGACNQRQELARRAVAAGEGGAQVDHAEGEQQHGRDQVQRVGAKQEGGEEACAGYGEGCAGCGWELPALVVAHRLTAGR